MERISTIQAERVITQPTDATERLTLIEKLEQELAENCRLNNWGLGFQAAIAIVKQHSDWIPVSDLPKEEKDWLVRFKKEDCFGLTMAVSKFYLEAQKFDCFHSKVTHYMALPVAPHTGAWIETIFGTAIRY